MEAHARSWAQEMVPRVAMPVPTVGHTFTCQEVLEHRRVHHSCSICVYFLFTFIHAFFLIINHMPDDVNTPPNDVITRLHPPTMGRVKSRDERDGLTQRVRSTNYGSVQKPRWARRVDTNFRGRVDVAWASLVQFHRSYHLVALSELVWFVLQRVDFHRLIHGSGRPVLFAGSVFSEVAMLTSRSLIGFDFASGPQNSLFEWKSKNPTNEIDPTEKQIHNGII